MIDDYVNVYVTSKVLFYVLHYMESELLLPAGKRSRKISNIGPIYITWKMPLRRKTQLHFCHSLLRAGITLAQEVLIYNVFRRSDVPHVHADV